MNSMKYCPYCMTPVSEDGSCPSCGLTSGSYTPLPHHIPPGTVLMERYLIGRVLGEGGFGITYIGCDLRLELKVAIKEYFPTNWVARHSEFSLSVSSYAGAAVAENEESLLALLADENCTAVVLSGRVWFGGDLPELRKPLLVAEGASITINQHITLGEGGLLWVEGYAESIFTIEEGQVVLSGDGVIVGSLLQLNSGGLVQLGGTLNCSYYCLEEDTIFEEAVSVSTSKAPS